MTVPHHNRVGSVLDLKNKRQRDATMGMKSYPICSGWLLKKKLWTVLMCILFFFFLHFLETPSKVSQYLTGSLPYNSGTTQNDFWIKETDKRGQKWWQKEAKNSINRGWQLIITIADLEIVSGAKNTPLLQIVIPGATVDQIDFRSDQVSTNSLILHFNM